MNTQPKVFAIVLNYNGGDFLYPCLESLYKSDYPNLEIVVCDNASTDGSLEKAKNKFPKFHFIKNDKNIGFGTGNNVAIRFALEKMAKYVFLLNNDATVQSDTISKLIKEAQKDEQIGLMSPLILTPENKIWFAGGKINWLKMKTLHCENICKKTEYINGCACLISQKVFEKVGLFDENFFLYYEDTDLSVRASRNGFKLKIVKNAIAYHAEKSNELNENKIYWLVLSGILFFKKNSRWLNKIWINFYLFLRKIKNKKDLKKNPKNKIAQKVARAYQDATKI